MTTAPTRRGRGQPSALNRPLELPDGTRTTVATRILELVAQAVPLEHAAGAAGIHPGTLRDWLATGGKIAADLAARRRTRASLTPHELECWQFSADVTRVREGWIANTLVGLDEARRGGRTATKTVTKTNAGGEVIEVVTTVEELLPNVHAATWLLERSLPKEFGRRALEVTGADGGPVEVLTLSPAEVAADMRAFLEERRAQRAEGPAAP